MADDPGGRVSRRAFLGGVGLGFAASVSGCTQATAGDASGGLRGSLDVSGSSTVFPLVREMRKRFLEEYPRVSISLMSTGSGGGFQNHFCPGDTDFNNASRPIKPEEEAHCANNGVTPVELTVATDALTVVVNNDNDWAECVTVEELREIWAADTQPTTWQDVNDDWPDQELELYGPTDASGTFDYFSEAILGEETDSRRDYQATEQDQQIIQGVQNSEAAMGYLGFAHFSHNSDAVTALGIDDGDGCVQPTLQNAMDGSYTPLSRPLFTYPAKQSLARDHIAAFARFIVENATSEDIVAESVGYVPLDSDTQATMMERLETAIAEANEEANGE
jgi:phosphate transport system substrate-binding protein